ncbi:DUF6173 family protein [Acinetobacter baumannii]
MTDAYKIQQTLNSIRQSDNLAYTLAQDKDLQENPVITIEKTIRAQIEEFEAGLEEGYVLGAWLASFGNQILILVESIEFSKPNVIIFKGKDDQGNKLQLIQHVNQLNLLLNAVKNNPEIPRSKIGFITSD